MKKPRMCSRFYCDRRGERFCCIDCQLRWKCLNSCENHPDRCGLQDRGQRIQSALVQKIHSKLV